MIGRVGIVDRAGLDEQGSTAPVQRADAGTRHCAPSGEPVRTGPEPCSPPRPRGRGFRWPTTRSPDIPVAFIGVWDTVGALGIPSYIGVPDLLRSRERYEFLNVVLDPRIPHARHAVSLDEMRGPFRPTLWEEPPADATQDIKQVWFPGDHCDVGGGHTDARLSERRTALDGRRSGGGRRSPVPAGRRRGYRADPVNGTLHGMGLGPGAR